MKDLVAGIDGELQYKNCRSSDGSGLRSPVIEKPVHLKYATSGVDKAHRSLYI